MRQHILFWLEVLAFLLFFAVLMGVCLYLLHAVAIYSG